MSDIAVRAENLSKMYNLGRIDHKTLQKNFVSYFARKFGKEDPNVSVDPALRYDQENNHFWAMRDVSFDIKKGDRVGLVGPNGAGKSTLLKILSRITTPTSGYVGINGRVSSLLEVGTGFHPELTGRENIFLNGAILGMSGKETKSKFDQIVDFSEISEFIDTPVKRYSSGMYVRLAFSVAAHLDPDVLILDEVLAVGDASFQKKCTDKIDQIASEGNRTIIFVSHNMEQVRKVCKYTIAMNGGRVVEIKSL